jgi:hypothetical protein
LHPSTVVRIGEVPCTTGAAERLAVSEVGGGPAATTEKMAELKAAEYCAFPGKLTVSVY